MVEVREYKYLRYIIKYNGKQEVYIRERMRKGVALLRKNRFKKRALRKENLIVR